jgi:hypothetical protein
MTRIAPIALVCLHFLPIKESLDQALLKYLKVRTFPTWIWTIDPHTVTSINGEEAIS